MKSDAELLLIWKNHNKTYEGYWTYEDLPTNEKMRIFDLISNTKKNVPKKKD